MKKKRAKPGEVQDWLNAHLAQEEHGEACIEWPFGRTTHGYGHVKWNGRCSEAHRVVLIESTGEEHKHLNAAHECGNRGCVNRSHLFWKTVAENSADRIRHDTHMRGERHKLAKLTKAQAIAIFKDKRSQRNIAKAYEVSDSLVYMIKARRSWAWATEGL